GSIAASYTKPSGQSTSVEYKITSGSIILDSSTSSTVSAGSLNASGTVFNLNMKPVCLLLDSETADGNELSVTVKLSGFVCDEGEQKGRSLGSISKKFSVKPFYDYDTLVTGVTFSTISDTTNKKIKIPVNGSVSLAGGAAVTFATDDTIDSSYDTSGFTLGTGSGYIYVYPNADLTALDCTATLTVSGIIPELNGSSYTRGFTVNFKPLYVDLDGVLDEEAWTEDAVTSTQSYADPSGYNLQKLYVTNDDTNLYVAVTGDFSSFGDGDRIILMIDNASSSDSGKSNADKDNDNYLVIATNETFSGADFYMCHILSSTTMHDITWGARTDCTETSLSSVTDSAIEYKIPLSCIANASAGNTLRIFASATDYTWTTINENEMKDCIPSAAAAVSNGGQTVSVDFSKALEYTVTAE
uniref:hypothetical protein n=1 Tax=Treponema sp. TaxID=166 RepID=UPI003890BCCF